MEKENALTVNDIFRTFGDSYREKHPFLSVHEKKIMRAIELCRTENLGGRIEVCGQCGHTVLHYHSCRNRHCPQCQFMRKEQWIESRKNEVFPFQYFHVVFTLPHKLNGIVLRNKKLLYDLLFAKAKETLLSAAENRKYFGAKIGFFSILHTWGQKLDLHPHLHCVVPGGGYDEKTGIWKKSARDYLLPVNVLKLRFRSLFLKGLKELYKQNLLFLPGIGYQSFQRLVDELFETDWVVYLKESFRNSDTVIEYLARYTHRIAISNYRIIKTENDNVHFSYKDYKENNTRKIMILPAHDFIGRFLLHVLPKRYTRIRYYGLLAHRNKKIKLDSCFAFFKKKRKIREICKGPDELFFELTGIDIHKCPKCGAEMLPETEELPANRYRPPPAETA